jgi:hypothetical protein
MGGLSMRFAVCGEEFDKKTATENHTLKSVNNCLDTNIYSSLETSCGQSINLYLNFVHFFNTSVNKTSVAA